MNLLTPPFEAGLLFCNFFRFFLVYTLFNQNNNCFFVYLYLRFSVDFKAAYIYNIIYKII
jgi:hypothetical protein